MLLQLVYMIIVFISLNYFVYLVKNNKVDLQLDSRERKKLPFVSIIVPTLDEEKNLEKCLRSLRKLQYPYYEVIVSDGGSYDKTVEIAEKYADKVIVDSRLPKGWVGKSYGCHLGYLEAKGSILLFTDADTEHSPESLDITVRQLLGYNATLLTLLPFQEAKKWYEFITGYYFFISMFVSGTREEINNKYNKESFFAIGQYLLFQREKYEKVGGHIAVAGALVEDFALAKLCKEFEQSIHVMDSKKMVTCRMYPESFKSFFQGFKKSIWGGLVLVKKSRVALVAIVLIYGLAAPIAMTLAIINSSSILIIVINIICYALYLYLLYQYWHDKGEGDFLFYFLYPFGLVITIAIIVLSIYHGIMGNAVTWRGRSYQSQELIETIYKKS